MAQDFNGLFGNVGPLTRMSEARDAFSGATGLATFVVLPDRIETLNMLAKRLFKPVAGQPYEARLEFLYALILCAEEARYRIDDKTGRARPRIRLHLPSRH